MPQVFRSQFVENLHALLERPLDEPSLRWISKDAFEITRNEQHAKKALSPTWDFHSLGSFVRQLSYYGFKRLSDRRRPTERNASFIVFTCVTSPLTPEIPYYAPTFNPKIPTQYGHPSGKFLSGDSSKLDLVIRRPRNRNATGTPRRTSESSTQSSCPSDGDPLPSKRKLLKHGDRILEYGDRPQPTPLESGPGAPIPILNSSKPRNHASPPASTVRKPRAGSDILWSANEGQGWRQYNPTYDVYDPYPHPSKDYHIPSSFPQTSPAPYPPHQYETLDYHQRQSPTFQQSFCSPMNNFNFPPTRFDRQEFGSYVMTNGH